MNIVLSAVRTAVLGIRKVNGDYLAGQAGYDIVRHRQNIITDANNPIQTVGVVGKQLRAVHAG